MLRKRVNATRSRTTSRARASKRSKTIAVPAPRWTTMRNPSAPTVKPQFRAKMIYCDYFTINPGAGGATGTRVYSANGCYDPDTTGVGHQPAGFDELMSIYAEYVVVGSTCKINARSVTSGEAFLAGISVQRSNTTYTDFRRYVENADTVWTAVDGFGTTGNATKFITHKCDMRDAGTNVLTDADFFGTAGSNPAEQRFYHILCQMYNGTGDLPAQEFWIEITYDVIFRDRVTTDIS